MRTVAYLTIVACFLVSFAGAAQAQYGSPVYDELEPYCAALRDQLAQKGVEQGGQYHQPEEGEWDELSDHPECRQFRDETQDRVLDGKQLPSYGECKRTLGMMYCRGLNNYGCDLVFSTPFTGVLCIQGLNPYA